MTLEQLRVLNSQFKPENPQGNPCDCGWEIVRRLESPSSRDLELYHLLYFQMAPTILSPTIPSRAPYVQYIHYPRLV